MKTELRPINEIAFEIKDLWIKECGPSYGQPGKKYYYAAGQLDAMTTLRVITDNFYADSGRGVVASFLCNVTTWRGDDARRIKAELNKHLKN